MKNLSNEQKSGKIEIALRQVRQETCGQSLEAQRCRVAITEFLTHSGVDTKSRLYDLLITHEARAEALASLRA